MKTIVEIKTKISKYLFNDDKKIIINNNSIDCGEFIISDLNESNCIVYENVNAPTDWFGCKYIFNGTNWELNPNYEEYQPVIE